VRWEQGARKFELKLPQIRGRLLPPSAGTHAVHVRRFFVRSTAELVTYAVHLSS